MTRSTFGSLMLGVLAVLAICRPAAAQTNNTALNAVALMVGQMALATSVDDGGNSQRWYKYQVRGGRSYCVEVAPAAFEDTKADPILNVYRSDATTAAAPSSPSDNAADEPPADANSRVCYVATTGEQNYLKITDNTTGLLYYSVRVLETTLFSNWFYVGAEYHAFSQIRNTTDTSVSYRMNWRNLAGAVVETTSGVLAGNATVSFNGKTFGGVLGATWGSVEVVHAGSPDAIVANTTVLSPTTGLSFDAPFMRRATW